MSKARTFQIERFYFGHVIQGGQPQGVPGVISSTPGISAQQVEECLQLARVPPPSPNGDDMPSGLGFFRGNSIEYIFTKAQRTDTGHPQLLYMLLPVMALRWLGGNYGLFESLGYDAMRTIDSVRRDLSPLTLEDPQPLSDEEQRDLLYDLFQYCGDKVKNVEGLVAALIHERPIAVLNAPLSLQKRMRFIQGLLSLLPAPARVGITWATHADNPTDTRAQIKFMGAASQPEGHMVYDWEKGDLLTPVNADKYSKFIVSQLRLDPSLVIENTTSIARTAVWRAMRKESLPQALHFASRRAALDSAVLNNQPADRETVAAILRQDPTLSDDLRTRYARHLLAFTLALSEESEHTEVLPMVAAANPGIGQVIREQLAVAAGGENPYGVYSLLDYWYQEVPQAESLDWHLLAHQAALTHLDKLLGAGKAGEAVTFLDELTRAHPRLKIEGVAPRIALKVITSPAYNADLALAVFLLTAEYLPAGDFQRGSSDPRLFRQLPQRLQEALYYLIADNRPPNTPTSLLIKATADLAPRPRLVVVSRLAEWAVQRGKPELIDSRTLEGILRASKVGQAERFSVVMNYLAEEYTHPQKLVALPPEMLEVLPLLYFSTENHVAGVKLLEIYQNRVYTPERLAEFTEALGRIFSRQELAWSLVEKIIPLLERSQLRPEPRVKIFVTLLEQGNWDTSYKLLASRLTAMLTSDNGLVRIASVDSTLKLLGLNVAVQDRVLVWQTGEMLVDLAVKAKAKSLDLMTRVWESIATDPAFNDLNLDLLRYFVRQVDVSIAATLPAHFEKLKVGLGDTLQATYVMRTVMGGVDFKEFTETIGYTTAMLVDIATTYHENKERPPIHRLRQGLDSMSGGLDEIDREAIANNLESIARSVYELGNRRAASQTAEAALLKNETVPTTGVGMLLFLGGYFAKGQRFNLDLTREGVAHLFGNRSATMLLRESGLISYMLHNLLEAFPPGKPPTIPLNALKEEIESLWTQLSLYNQRQTKPALAEECQQLAQVIPAMSQHAKERLFKDKQFDTGKAQPENGLEALRWTAGYFARTHRR